MNPTGIGTAMSRYRSRARRAHGWLLVSPARSILLVGLLGFTMAMLLTWCRVWVPAPRVHDEFSYLLASDTFARGRVTNPTHPLWEHFESFHVLQLPTYASKYPPAQGLFLVLGQVLFGEPIVGVWLSYGLMCAALTWMLFGWVPPRWALWGGVFASIWLVGIQTENGYWARTYWGGAVAALGSALLFGGLRRITRSPAVLPSIVTAIGVGILANSRPYEGLLIAALPAAFLFVWLVTSRARTISWRMTHVVLPLVLALLSVGSLMAFYNFRVTGKAWELPYATYERTYATKPALMWQSPPETPEYGHEVMRKFYTATRLNRPGPTSFSEFLKVSLNKLRSLQQFFLPGYLIFLLIMIPWVLRNRWNRLAGASIGLALVGMMATPWHLAHYGAPAVGPLVILFTESARRLRMFRTRRSHFGVMILRLVFACGVLWAAASFSANLRTRDSERRHWAVRRAAIQRELESSDRKHIVIVDYGPKHSTLWEWVYNEADIDASAVVWARSMDRERNARLLTYFSDRTAWTLHIDNDNGPFRLQPVGRRGKNE